MTDFIPSDLRVMTALSTVLIKDTNIQTVGIDKGLIITTVPLPALVLSVPQDRRIQQAFGAIHGWMHQVAAVYHDSWITSSRTYEQLMADTRATLNLMCQNLGENPCLTIDGTNNAIEGGMEIDRRIDGPVDKTKEYGFWLLSAYLVITIRGLIEEYTIA